MMKDKEKRVFKEYSECIIMAMDFAIAEKWKDSVFYDGMALGIKRVFFRSEFAALLERTYNEYVDYVNGNSKYNYDEVVMIIKEGWA